MYIALKRYFCMHVLYKRHKNGHSNGALFYRYLASHIFYDLDHSQTKKNSEHAPLSDEAWRYDGFPSSVSSRYRSRRFFLNEPPNATCGRLCKLYLKRASDRADCGDSRAEPVN